MFKNFFITIIILFTNILMVNALEYYDINEMDWYDEKIESDYLEIIEKERRYKWYKENIIYSDTYYIEGLNPSQFPYKIEEDYIETAFSEWDHVFIPTPYPGRIIEERLVKKYRELRPIRYIFFEDLSGPYLSFKISELNILIDGQEIDYNIQCFECSSNFEYYLKNNIIQENDAYVNNGGRFRIDLGNYYAINKIKIELFMYDTMIGPKKAKIYMNEGSTVDSNNYAYKEFVSYVVSQSYLEPEKYIITADHSWIVNPVWQDWVYVDNILVGTYYRQMVIANERRYKDIMYRYYGIEREYLDGYYVTLDNEQYIKDENQYKDYYRYRIIGNDKKESEKNKKVKIETKKEVVKKEKMVDKKIKENKDTTIITENKESLLSDNKIFKKTENIKKDEKKEIITKNNNNLFIIGSILVCSIILLVMIKKRNKIVG